MRKYVYDNATVYITIPTEEQVQNIRKSTKQFVDMLAKKGELQNGRNEEGNRGSRRNNRRTANRTRSTPGVNR